MFEPKVHEIVRQVKCPHCGYKGEEEESEGICFYYVETTSSYQHINGISKEGVLVVDCWSENSDGGSDPRVQCQKCYREFPIPDDIEVDSI